MKRILIAVLILLAIDACGQVKRSGRRVMGSGVGRVASSGTFTDSFDGSSLGSRWSTSGSWTVGSGVASCSPAIGPEVLGNTGFSDGSLWALYGGWSIAGGVCVGSASEGFARQSELEAGYWYYGSRDIKTRTSGQTAQILGGTQEMYSTAAQDGIITTAIAESAPMYVYAYPSFQGTIDNVSAKKLNKASAIATIDAHRSDVDVSVSLTNASSPHSTLSGLVVSYADTANMVVAYIAYDKCKIVKYVSNTQTVVVNGTISYSAGAYLRVVKSGTSYSLVYNGQLVGIGTISDVSIISNTKHGIVSLYSGNTLDNFSCTISTGSVYFLAMGDSKTATINQWRVALSSGVYIDAGHSLSHDGWTVKNLNDGLAAHFATVTKVPDFVLVNIGVNDQSYNTPFANYADTLTRVVDTIHAHWGSVNIGVVRPWLRSGDAYCDSLASRIGTIVGARSSYTFLGPDERVWLKGSDNGATMTYDGTHYSEAGNAECARQWRTILDSKR